MRFMTYSAAQGQAENLCLTGKTPKKPIQARHINWQIFPKIERFCSMSVSSALRSAGQHQRSQIQYHPAP